MCLTESSMIIEDRVVTKRKMLMSLHCMQCVHALGASWHQFDFFEDKSFLRDNWASIKLALDYLIKNHRLAQQYLDSKEYIGQ